MDFIVGNLKQVILGIGAAILLIVIIKNFKQIKKFISEVKTELKKVSWSTKEELMTASVMVIIITGLLAVFLGLTDYGFSRALSLVIK